ncbi:NAD(P)-binding domain-containing protein [Halomonas cupida]|uniref:NAD(P)-binding domain-containing protein n=1 Tax=Halomonas cupida TaxID=44933 RepID=UPI003EF30DF1
MNQTSGRIAIIGGGPVGLAACAHALAHGLDPLVIEAGKGVGEHLRQWGHVRMFTPWECNLDGHAVALLQASGWQPPGGNACPTGQELVDHYLTPLANLPELRDRVYLQNRVLGVSRSGIDVLKDKGRFEAPFVLRIEDPDGERDLFADAVIDASGTFGQPNWMGGHGMPALGEARLAQRVTYGLPSVLKEGRDRYANRRVLVVGAGHSAFNLLRDLAELAKAAPDTRVLWAIRGDSPARMFCGCADDPLEERGRLGLEVQRLVSDGRIEVYPGVRIERLEERADGLVIQGQGHGLPPVDEVVVATGFRPDLSLLSELRLELDPATQSPVRLAPLIDPNVHSCGSVPSHGAEELRHPEQGLFILGIKSYGRAPTFLLRTGYEQVRSVVAMLAEGAARGSFGHR